MDFQDQYTEISLVKVNRTMENSLAVEETTKDPTSLIISKPQQMNENSVNGKQITGLMTNSTGSGLEDTTPTDSGVQLLDSESSELNESLMSSSGAEFDINPPELCTTLSLISKDILDEPQSNNPIMVRSANAVIDLEKASDVQECLMTKSDIINSNVSKSITDSFIVVELENRDSTSEQEPVNDEMQTSVCSTFDTNESIVFRRKVKKNKNAPKKRVSFHEDILNNTRTDNIHIEHGFITYKGGSSRKLPHASRYSWSSEGDGEQNHHIYRNACSDVLDYGNTEVFEEDVKNLSHDNSGVFEYGNQTFAQPMNGDNLYKCSCSSSNSSLDDEANQNVIGTENMESNFRRTKSGSCDCIEKSKSLSMVNNNIDNRNYCYFSDPSIEATDSSSDDQCRPMSVWNKEKKPKSSCLKKTSKRATNIIQEKDINVNVKKFNIHPLPDMNNIIDNSKMIFGSLKNILGMNLAERGVPEGCEDGTSVEECMAHVQPREQSSACKPRPFLSKSLDGGLLEGNQKKKNFIHDVDSKLRRANENDLYAPSNNASRKNSDSEDPSEEQSERNTESMSSTGFRNKYIIDCESIVFEHTGVSICYDSSNGTELPFGLTSQPSPKPSAFSAGPIKQKFSNMLKSLRDSSSVLAQPDLNTPEMYNSTLSSITEGPSQINSPMDQFIDAVNSMESSIISTVSSDKLSDPSEISSTSQNASISVTSTTQSSIPTSANNENYQRNLSSPSRHLVSPRRRQVITTKKSTMNSEMLSPNSRDYKMKNNTDDFDDILTITTIDSDKSDIVILDYPENISEYSNQFLRPPIGPASKTSLINRFLRNVTQKKILDAVAINRRSKPQPVAIKPASEKKLFEKLYMKTPRPLNKDVVMNLNAEITMEIQNSQINLPVKFETPNPSPEDNGKRFIEAGVGEIAVEIFNNHQLNIFRNDDEILMKVFKFYTGYSREGTMTPVLVFLTDKTLYVTDFVRNRLCNKFVLPYIDLDVILMGPNGNTVLLSNNARDMQQVLLAGGPYPTDRLVGSLELCARRGGFILPAVGQLTLNHLVPLQSFVRDNSCAGKKDSWIYYTVVTVPASLLIEEEPIGPYRKGPLMHRRLMQTNYSQSHQWMAGYFLLKAGVLYMFVDNAQKIPTWALPMIECQGVRRMTTSNRPHCFEILLKDDILQFAAPDEYVASDWLQALVQSASGLFEMQEKQSTLGCTVVMTDNHLITLREDFTSPLRRLNANINASPKREYLGTSSNLMGSMIRKMSNSNSNAETMSDISSVCSTPSRTTLDKSMSTSGMSNYTKPHGILPRSSSYPEEKSFTNMSSIYGKNSGVEVLMCAAIEELIAVHLPSNKDQWWCILEFSCQEVRESSDDLVLLFSTLAEFQQFLHTLERQFLATNINDFPSNILPKADPLYEQCTKLFKSQQNSWEPLLSAALGHPQ